MGSLIDARSIAEDLRAEVAAEVVRLRRTHGLVPTLAVLLVGDDPASAIYVASKARQSEEIGIGSIVHRLDAATRQDELVALVRRLSADPAVHGILVQLPLPKGLDEAAVLAALAPEKDVDGLTAASIAALASGRPGLTPCTPKGCMILLARTLGPLAGLEAVVIGRSILVGRPLAQLLIAADCTVTVAHSKTRDLPDITRRADILAVAAGRPRMVRGSWIKSGATVIDVGVNRVPFRDPVKAAAGKTKVVGDVATSEALEHAQWVTPVPGGVGLMTVACLLDNTVIAAKAIAGV